MSLLIFDWDDTLLPTTEIDGGRVDDPKGLLDVQEAAANLLRQASVLGTVCIVTNSEEGWVDLSCDQYMPAMKDVIKEHKVQVVSARSTYEEKHPGRQFAKWKELVFRDIFDREQPTQVIAFGDADDDRTAAQSLLTCCKTVKNLKFSPCPSVRGLLVQLNLVTLCLRTIVNISGSLDMKLTIV